MSIKKNIGILALKWAILGAVSIFAISQPIPFSQEKYSAGVSSVVHAADEEAEEPEKKEDGFLGGFEAVDGGREAAGIKEGDLKGFAISILKIILAFLAILAFIAIIWGGIMYILSLGDDDKVKTAKKIILYAIIGLLIVGVAGIVVNVILGLIVPPEE